MFLIVSPSKSERSQSDFELMIIFWCVCVCDALSFSALFITTFHIAVG